jgi:Flp pilus assembly protein TadG
MRLASRLARPFRSVDFARDRRGAHLVELAIVYPVFLVFLLMLFEVAYDQFLQGVLESAVQFTAYQVQTGNTYNTTVGTNPPTATTAQLFIDNQLCPNAIARTLNCSSLYVQIQTFVPSASCTDFYQVTNGGLPLSTQGLALGDYSNDAGGFGSGGTVAPSTGCGDSNAGFCNAGAGQNIVMNVIYVAPTFLGGLLPGRAVKYNGNYVHASVATSAFYTEAFVPSTTTVSGQCS